MNFGMILEFVGSTFS